MSSPAPGPLGFILPQDRTQDQQDAHQRAMAATPRFASLASASDLLATIDVPKGTKVMLTDYWKHPDVVADIGQPFTGFGQKTGSCVGVSEGNAATTILCVQRAISDAPTKAEVVFWPHPYGRTRYNEGDRGQGEGAVDSVMGETLVKEGFYDINQPGLPKFNAGPDGYWLAGGAAVEMQWSDGARIAQPWIDLAAKRAGMTKVVVTSAEQEIAGIINGYPVLTGCSMYVGRGAIKGSGENAYVVGRFDGNGGHSTCRLGAWLHPTDGWLIGYSNQWDTSTYPKDPAGLGRCCVWIPISEEQKQLDRLGGNNGETMLLSHAPGVPVQPKVLDWSTI